MNFGPLPIRDAEGEILAHNISDADGRRVLRKGRVLEPDDIELLESLGYGEVYVARLESDDVHEDDAASRIAGLAAGPGLQISRAHTGRVNLTAETTGVVRVDLELLDALNTASGVTVATVPTHSAARAGDRVATVKIIPYAVPRSTLSELESEIGGRTAMYLDPIEPREVCLVLVGGAGAWERMTEGIGEAVERRVEAFGCHVPEIDLVPLDVGALAATLSARAAGRPGLIVIAGETAIMDLDDLIPRGLRQAGGRVEGLGLAMDPGQLLLLAYLEDTPIVGAPGCVRGSAPDGFDAVVPRLLARERLTRTDLRALAHGGLLSNPRSR